jgi:hypothetical protein
MLAPFDSICNGGLSPLAAAAGDRAWARNPRAAGALQSVDRQQPVDSLRWAPTDRTILLAKDGLGSISILVELSNRLALHCATRLHSPAAARDMST